MKCTPSNSNIWSKCAAFPKMSTWFPRINKTNKYTEEGNYVHNKAEEFFKNGIPDKLDSEEDLAAAKYVETLKDNGYKEPIVERKIDIFSDMQGIPDAYYIDGDKLYVADLKYGYTIVEPEYNTALILYAYGIFRENKNIKEFNLSIYQPRAYHENGSFRTWRADSDTIHKEVIKLKIAQEETKKDNPIASSGMQCVYCPARRACSAYQNSVYNSVDRVYRLNDSNELKGHALAKELRILREADKMIKYRLLAIEEQIIHDGCCNGVTVKETKGRLAWIDDIEKEDLIKFAQSKNVDIVKPLDIITPTQASNKGLDVSNVSYRGEGSKKITINKKVSNIFDNK